MNFWKALAWICTVGFLAILMVSWIANHHHAQAQQDPGNEPPPAPIFR
jgi:hypothetical protein